MTIAVVVCCFAGRFPLADNASQK